MAATTIVFYGIRFDVVEDEIESLEERVHPAILTARKHGLDFYWGNFNSPSEHYYLFVGKSFGKLGLEDRADLQISVNEFNQATMDTSNRLHKAGFSEPSSLYIQWQPDI